MAIARIKCKYYNPLIALGGKTVSFYSVFYVCESCQKIWFVDVESTDEETKISDFQRYRGSLSFEALEKHLPEVSGNYNLEAERQLLKTIAQNL